jgi:bifunctional non-homologous end joining protein LigD
VIAGYTAPRGSRKYFGALVLGMYDHGELQFIGSAGTGFDESTQQEVLEKLEELRTSRAPFTTAPKLREEVTWIKPELVARIKYGNWTDDKHLRAPVFLGLRNDRKAKDCTFEELQPAEAPPSEQKGKYKAADTPGASHAKKGKKSTQEHSEQAAGDDAGQQKSGTREIVHARKGPAPRLASDPADELLHGKSDTIDIESDGQRIHFSNLNKIYFPAIGGKKRELLAYYYRMAEHILPFLKDRPMVLRRYPDGVDGKAFFQKEAPSYLPQWIETTTVYSDERGGDMQYILANNRATLLYLSNLGCLDHNPWSSRAESQDTPDYVFFDLDPTPGTPFSDVLHIAREISALLKSIRMKAYLKTSGASGFHIFIPLEPIYSYEQTRTFADVIGRMIAAENPKLITSERTVSKRPDGRIMIDALQNARGKPLACAYSIRAYPKATISAPLTAEELKKGIDPEQWNMRTLDRRMQEVGDLWADFWENRQTFDEALELLAKRVPKEPQKKK